MVHFVGAGPGATDLITIRGMNLLKKADMIIYAGSLVNRELLNYASKSCICHDSAYMHLDEIIDAIKTIHELCENEPCVVRLHTGDPSIYGAIKEQMDRLDELNISYDVCPGVSSMSGAAASLKTEYTLPKVSQSIIITRCEGKTKVPDNQDLKSFAVHNATMILFLSSALADKVSSDLIDGGYSKDTAVAVVYKASWVDEKIIRTTLINLPQAMKEASINKTALIIVGDVLSSDYELSKLYDKEFTTEFRKGVECLKKE